MTKRISGHKQPLLLGIALLIAVHGLAEEQTAAPASKPLEFEVATVKAAGPDAKGTMIMFQPGGGIQVKNATLLTLLTMAYDLRNLQIFGGPSWLKTDRFDIEAKAESSGTAPDVKTTTDAQRTEYVNQVKERVRSLLADRFQLVVHRETKEMPIYALLQGKGGSKLQSAKEAGGNVGLRMQRGVLTGMSAPVENLATAMADTVGRPVIDKTGLEGKFDWKLEWTPDPGPQEPGPSTEKQTASAPPDLSGPSIFTAIQEQLGLKLESQKGPAPVLIIDRAERLSAN